MELQTDDLSVRALMERFRVLTAQIESLSATVHEQQDELNRLRATATVQVSAQNPPARSKQIVGRRSMMKTVLSATAVATLLSVAREPSITRADSRTTITGPATGQYGIAAKAGGGIDPDPHITNIGGTSFGVIGVSASPGFTPPASAGVLGQGSGDYGTIGLSNSGIGVYGQSTSNYGVYGRSNSNVGLTGTSTSNWGLYGFSVSNTGVVGTSQSGWAMWGNSPGNVGVVGQTTTGIGVYGVTTGAGFAARFDGPIVVNGSFTATGMKSAAVPGRNGELVRMYCLESPESWFEDFGSVEIRNGLAEVALDPEFDALVRGNDYRVFLTEVGDCGGLYVSRKAPHRFEIKSRVAGVSGSCDYRVVARRKDVTGSRLEKVKFPKKIDAKDLPESLELPRAGGPAGDPTRPGR